MFPAKIITASLVYQSFDPLNIFVIEDTASAVGGCTVLFQNPSKIIPNSYAAHILAEDGFLVFSNTDRKVSRAYGM